MNIIHSADYMGSGKLDYLLFPSVLALDYLIDSFGLCTLHYPPWIDFKSLNMNVEELNKEIIHSVLKLMRQSQSICNDKERDFYTLRFYQAFHIARDQVFLVI